MHLYRQLCLIISSLTCSALGCLMNMWTYRPPARWAHGLLWWPRTAIINVVSCLVKRLSLFLYCLSEIKFTTTTWRHAYQTRVRHYNDTTMSTMASQITRFLIAYSTVFSCGGQRKHQSSASLAFVRGNHRWQVNSPQKGPVTRKMVPFDDIIMGDRWFPS